MSALLVCSAGSSSRCAPRVPTTPIHEAGTTGRARQTPSPSSWGNLLHLGSYRHNLLRLVSLFGAQYHDNGQRTPGKALRHTSGESRICNSTYGNTGWIGVAQNLGEWHLYHAGVVKMNDTYFNSRNTRHSVALPRDVPEVGHTLGRDHQDEFPQYARIYGT